MRIELAPMEGITTYIYRNALCKYFGGIDTYFSPFISTHEKKLLNFKEIKEIKPENNIGYKLIPQVLTANADEFAVTSSQIAEYGYDHINLNFGCPSGTVTPKGKGAGALLDLEGLERLLDAIFSKTDFKISIKTRMGFSDYSEWEKILKVYEKFPLEELIVHARVREDFYNGRANMDALSESLNNYENVNQDTKIKFSYNGDIFSAADFSKVTERMPYLDACMIGRGLICNPALGNEIKQGSNSDFVSTLKSFNHELVDNYSKIMPGDKNTLFKMKELWVYLIKTFERNELPEKAREIYIPNFKSIPETSFAKKLLKSIRKCNSLNEYLRIVDSI